MVLLIFFTGTSFRTYRYPTYLLLGAEDGVPVSNGGLANGRGPTLTQAGPDELPPPYPSMTGT